MRFFAAAGLILAGMSSLCFGQLTTEQKISDFQQTVGLFVKGYGPYEWKKQLLGFDLADTDPWIAKIRATKSDLEFYELMYLYIASLDDAHSVYDFYSSYIGNLNFGVDIYDGRLLIDNINRTRLPAGEYPFAIGYELVSIDGEAATAILDKLIKYSALANPRSSRRNAASLITVRPQRIVFGMAEVPEISTVVLRRYDGKLETYRIPWSRSGLKMPGNGKLPNPNAARLLRPGAASGDGEPVVAETPDYMKPLEALWNCRLPERKAILNYGAVTPVFSRGLPGTFVQRLGRLSTDFFYSGTYVSEGQRIGFIRIPTYAPSDQNGALTQFVREIAYMQENTDGLVVDQTRNPGGSVAYQHALVSFLFHYPWRGMAFEVRATSIWLASISSSYESAKAQGAPASILALLENILVALQEANRTPQGMTVPIPLDDVEITRQPAKDARGNLLSYTKPTIFLADEFSASGGDAFAAIMQDNGRGPIFGYRTMGAGGNVTSWKAGSYSEGLVNRTESLMSRATERAEAGYPVSRYVENVGVHPDIEYDYMTQENLTLGGRPFVNAFTAAMVEQIGKNR
ncbi:MAG: S41 family peptidase [Bryobacteraceae bacterium]|nr:S41 family peptidase [Bryobacteraceae bacterium]